MVLIDVKYYNDPEILFIIVQVLRNIIIIEQNLQVYSVAIVNSWNLPVSHALHDCSFAVEY